MSRKLASVQRIENIRPIDGADAIEVCNVLGWNVVIKKGEFNEGDLVVYCETDSILPEKEEFEFLRPRKFRIKIAKMRGQVSEGICFPLTILPAGNYSVGQDVTETIGVTKYDPQEEDERPTLLVRTPKNKFEKLLMKNKWYRELTKKKVLTGFPSFVQKTDEERIQTCKGILKKLRRYEMTEKLEGQSATFAIQKKKLSLLQKLMREEQYEYFVCSRTQRKSEKDGSNWAKVSLNLGMKDKLIQMLEKERLNGIAIQGEIIGPGIQKNIYQLNELQFYAYNIVKLQKDGTYKLTESMAQVEKELASYFIKTVPILGEISLDYTNTVDQIVELAKGYSKLFRTKREGIVFREYGGFGAREKVSFKAINPDYLLGQKD